jgi:hypothetical protein
LYGALLFALLLFIFRHSTIRTFFLSLLAGVVLVILSSIFTAIFGSFETAVYEWYLFYFILFTIIGAWAFRHKNRKAIAGIAINLWVLMLSFIPSICVALYYEILDQHAYDLYERGITTSVETAYDYELKVLLVQVAEIAGPVLFLAAVYFYIHRLYRQWYALPEQ